jgi:predicted DNA-binding protein
MNDKLIITKKLKGDDDFKTFSIRIKQGTVNKLNDLADKTNRSRNELVNIILDYGLDNCEFED